MVSKLRSRITRIDGCSRRSNSGVRYYSCFLARKRKLASACKGRMMCVDEHDSIETMAIASRANKLKSWRLVQCLALVRICIEPTRLSQVEETNVENALARQRCSAALVVAGGAR